MKLFLIGTSHRFQASGGGAKEAEVALFRRLVWSAANLNGIRAIAEEMSLEGLQARGATESVCQEVARELNVVHCYCDPNEAERAALGIEPENLILAHVSIGSPRGTTKQEIVAAAAPLIDASHRKREAEWLSRLVSAWRGPTLFVCGAVHVDSFGRLAERSGYAVFVLEQDWVPT